MGASAVVVSLRRAVERGPVVGQTDDVLVARIRAGDDGAFEAVYDRYARGVLAFCVHMLGSREEAEDALQLTFVSAYRGLRRSQNEIALRPWLYTIARNRCLSELRIRREAVEADGVVAERSSSDGLADQVQRREDLRELVEDMQRLPEDQRAALVLFEMGDHSHKEIAAVLGIRTEKVKALIFQAREGLVRGRRARERSCVEIRERLATSETRVLPRSMTRAHIERCPSCAAFEDEVVRQRAAFALILPLAVSAELKTAVLSAVLGGGGAAGVGAAAAGGTGAAATAAIAGSQSVAVFASGVVAAATLGLSGADATRLMAKLLTAAAIATGAAAPGHNGGQPETGPSAISRTAPATPAAAATTPAAAAIRPLRGTSPASSVPVDAPQPGGWTTPGQAIGSGATGSAASPGRGASSGQSTSAPGSAGVAQTVTSSSPTAPRDVAGAGSTSSAPGQSATAPGQSATAPGQSGAAPGQSGTAPGQSGAAPGHSGTAPGQSGAAPGQSGTAPGQSGTAPGQSGTAPGHSGTAPGQSGAAHGNGPPSTPPGQSGSGQGNGPSSTPPGQSGAAQGGQPASSGPPDPSSPGKSGTAPGHSGASNGHGGPAQ